MGGWRHTICEACWRRLNPDRVSVKLRPEHRERERCCVCGEEHESGIYFRADPVEMLCGGECDA